MNRYLCLLACLSFLVWTGRAQDALSSPPTASPSASAVQEFNANQPGTIPVPDASIGVAPVATPFHWGPVDMRPHFLYRFLYGNGIPAQPGKDTKTVINQVSPGVSLQLGSHWSLDYTPNCTQLFQQQVQRPSRPGVAFEFRHRLSRLGLKPEPQLFRDFIPAWSKRPNKPIASP